MSIQRRLLFFLLLLLAGAAFYWFFGPSRVNSWRIRNAPPAAFGPVVAFGDSLTAGRGAEGAENSYPAALSSLLGRPVENMGVDGDTVARAYERLEKVLERSPSIVVVLLGGNDMLRRMDFDESFSLLETMIRRIQEEGALVFVAGLEGLPLLAPVGKRYFEAAKNTGSVLVPDVLKDILGKPELMADGIHPNAAGYRIMAERIAKAMAPYLR